MNDLARNGYFIIEGRWFDRDSKSEGVVTTKVNVERPLKDYEKIMRIWGQNGILAKSRRSATERVLERARRIRFMDVTGLIPSRAWPFRMGVSFSRAPYREKPLVAPEFFDHTSVWRLGPYRKQNLIIATEPYDGRFNPDDPRDMEDARAWCDYHDWRMAVFPRTGMWNPPSTHLVLLAHREAFGFDSVLERVAGFDCRIKVRATEIRVPQHRRPDLR